MKLLVEILILPPFNLLLLAAAGLILLRWRKRAGVIAISVAVFFLYVFSAPVTSALLSHSVRSNDYHPVLPGDASLAEAIVILGAGQYVNAPEYFGDTIRGTALERVRYGAFLHNQTGLPILVTGGDPNHSGSSEADVMRAVLETEFGVAVLWSEDASDNTRESARNSWGILQRGALEAIYLVTHSDHMPRAVSAFSAVGFQVTPAPTIFPRPPSIGWLDFIPRSNAMSGSANAIKEWIGRGWYAIRN